MSDACFELQQLREERTNTSPRNASRLSPLRDESLLSDFELSNIQSLISILRLSYSRAGIEAQKIQDLKRHVVLIRDEAPHPFIIDYLESSYRRRIGYYIDRVERDVARIEAIYSNICYNRSAVVPSYVEPTIRYLEEATETEVVSGGSSTKSIVKFTTGSSVEEAASSGTCQQVTPVTGSTSTVSVSNREYLSAHSQLEQHVRILHDLMAPSGDTDHLETELRAVLDELHAFVRLMEEVGHHLNQYRSVVSRRPRALPVPHEAHAAASQPTLRDSLRLSFRACFSFLCRCCITDKLKSNPA